MAASSPPKRAVVQQRESMEALDKWYKSADYQEALKIGKQHATFRRYALRGNKFSQVVESTSGSPRLAAPSFPVSAPFDIHCSFLKSAVVPFARPEIHYNMRYSRWMGRRAD